MQSYALQMILQRTMRAYRESEMKKRVRGNADEVMLFWSCVSNEPTTENTVWKSRLELVCKCEGKRNAVRSSATKSITSVWSIAVARSRISREGQSLSLALTEASISCHASRRRANRHAASCVFNRIFTNLSELHNQTLRTGIFQKIRKSLISNRTKKW